MTNESARPFANDARFPFYFILFFNSKFHFNSVLEYLQFGVAMFQEVARVSNRLCYWVLPSFFLNFFFKESPLKTDRRWRR